jgi:hypothetical protein
MYSIYSIIFSCLQLPSFDISELFLSDNSENIRFSAAVTEGAYHFSHFGLELSLCCMYTMIRDVFMLYYKLCKVKSFNQVHQCCYLYIRFLMFLTGIWFPWRACSLCTTLIKLLFLNLFFWISLYLLHTLVSACNRPMPLENTLMNFLSLFCIEGQICFKKYWPLLVAQMCLLVAYLKAYLAPQSIGS